MAVKREVSNVDSSPTTTPTKKTKFDTTQKSPRKEWTIEDARLIKKLKEEDNLDWKFFFHLNL
jgi:hypothetical protein